MLPCVARLSPYNSLQVLPGGCGAQALEQFDGKDTTWCKQGHRIHGGQRAFCFKSGLSVALLLKEAINGPQVLNLIGGDLAELSKAQRGAFDPEIMGNPAPPSENVEDDGS